MAHHMAGPDMAEPDLSDERSPGGSSATPEVIAVFGPTASGKSSLAEAIAARLATEVVSADAMQVYRRLPILTNQPAGRTRLVGIRELGEEMSVGAFATLAHRAIDALVEASGIAVVAGGTGLYLRAAVAELGIPPRAPEEARERIASEVEHDATAAYARLRRLDTRGAAAVHVNDRRRLARALELAEVGLTLSGQDRLWDRTTRRPTLIVGLDVPQDVLELRIRRRTEEMFARGVVAEVRDALAGPVSRTAEKTLGLREVAELEPAEALERIAARTRRYAAYQRKWMRRIPDLVLLDGTRPTGELAAEVVARARG